MNIIPSISIAQDWLWISFTIGIIGLLCLDLLFFGRGSKKINTKMALIESGMWIALSLTFNAWFAWSFGAELGVEFLTGYLIEKSLSVDNLFVILLIFSSFKIPSIYQHKVLFYGIVGAIVLRGLFIVLGAHLLQQFHWILYLFGIILIVTAIKFIIGTDKEIDAADSWSIRALKYLMPTTKKFNGNHFFVVEHGVKKATPLFLALIVIEVSDIIFAVDSIPAVFAVTHDAFVAYASNILAVLGLRALYFVLADWVAELRYLKPGLAVILGFIGTKMVLVDVIKIPSWISLLVIFSVMLTAGLSSWYVANVKRYE